MGYLNIIDEQEYLTSDYDWPTIHWIGSEESGFIRYSAPYGYKVLNNKDSILETIDGAFYIKKRTDGIQE
jgi:hypothetical protein